MSKRGKIVPFEYKKETIHFHESGDKFHWGGRGYDTLSAAKRAIDKREKEKSPVKLPIDCIVIQGFGRDPKFGRITSITSRNSARITLKGEAGTQTTWNETKFAPLTERNLEVMDEIDTLQRAIQSCQQEIKDWKRQLEGTYDLAELVDGKQANGE